MVLFADLFDKRHEMSFTHAWNTKWNKNNKFLLVAFSSFFSLFHFLGLFPPFWFQRFSAIFLAQFHWLIIFWRIWIIIPLIAFPRYIHDFLKKFFIFEVLWFDRYIFVPAIHSYRKESHISLMNPKWFFWVVFSKIKCLPTNVIVKLIRHWRIIVSTKIFSLFFHCFH